MAAKTLTVSEARKQFSRLVDGVSRRRTAIAITQHGKRRAALIGIEEYEELLSKATAYERLQRKKKPFTLRGSLQVDGSLEELVDEMRQIRVQWSQSIQKSTEELTRRLAGK
jgi:prevent-host-death family protein